MKDVVKLPHPQQRLPAQQWAPGQARRPGTAGPDGEPNFEAVPCGTATEPEPRLPAEAGGRATHAGAGAGKKRAGPAAQRPWPGANAGAAGAAPAAQRRTEKPIVSRAACALSIVLIKQTFLDFIRSLVVGFACLLCTFQSDLFINNCTRSVS